MCEDISSGPRRVKIIQFVTHEFAFVEVFNNFHDDTFKKFAKVTKKTDRAIL